LLRTKLFIPPPHPDLVERQRLLDRLDRCARARLVLVTAPAGFGKTTLLSTWLAFSNFEAAWVALDSRDNDPIRFWSYLLAALQTLQPELGLSAQAMLQSPQPPPLEAILTTVLNEIAMTSREMLLVLDDYHTVENPAIHQGIAFVLGHAPAQLHLLVAGRTEPPLSLPALRVRRELVEIGPDDLRFSYDETAAFLSRVMRLEISPADIHRLEQQTEGWIAGLQLAALSLQSSEEPSKFVRSFSGSHHFIFDYLAQEVLQQQPEEMQEFLLQSSVLDTLSGAACDAVLGRKNSQLTLERLEQARLFLVPLDQQRSWYRYHHLFSEFLLTRLRQVYGDERVKELHLRASAWFDGQGQYLEAIEQALEAGETALGARLIVHRSDEIIGNSELITLLGWLDRLPAEVFDGLYPLSITAAWVNHATGKPEAAQKYLDRAEDSLGMKADGSTASLASSNETRLALAEIACMRANLAFHHQDLEQVALFSKLAQEYLAGAEPAGYYHTTETLLAVNEFNLALVSEFTGDIPAAVRSFHETIRLSQKLKNPHLLAISNSHLGRLLVVQGKLRQAAELYRKTLIEADRIVSRPTLMNGMVRVGLGNIFYEWDELDQAQGYLEAGINLGRQWANFETLLPGHTGLARYFFATGQLERAFEQIGELSRLLEGMQIPIGGSLVEAERAWLFLQSGEAAEARAWVDRCQASSGDNLTYMQEEGAIYLARFLAALNRPREALELTARLAGVVESGGRFGRLIEILVIEALAFDALGESAPALAALQRALKLAEPEGYRRTFLDAPEKLQTLLAMIQGPTSGYAGLLLSSWRKPLSQLEPMPDKAGEARPVTEVAPSTKGALESVIPIEALSERELEVLRLIAQGYSNQQIADQLYISLNTTKTHVKNILGRLRVENRTQAAARARELGLLK
jgi:LuxR family maltose regulon positive regulatory protein